MMEALKKDTMDVKEKVKPGMRSCVIHIHFYERGRYVAHNRDVEYHNSLLSIYSDKEVGSIVSPFLGRQRLLCIQSVRFLLHTAVVC